MSFKDLKGQLAR